VTVVGEEGADGPDGTEDGDDEEEEDVGWLEDVGFDIAVHEVCEHAHNGDQSEDLQETPEGEEDCEQHGDGD